MEAAAMGHASAHVNLGALYEDGALGDQFILDNQFNHPGARAIEALWSRYTDRAELDVGRTSSPAGMLAVCHYLAAAELGDVDAMFALGT
jgi:hypothetical protein